MHVHLAFAGRESDPTINMINAIAGIDKVVILYSKTDDNLYRDRAEALFDKLSESSRECELRVIKPFDFLNIVDTIYDIYEKSTRDGQKIKFSVDITTGTNLMSAAACTTAFFTNADVFYMMDKRLFPEKSLDELLVPIPSPKIPDVKRLGDLSLEILRYVGDEQDKGNEVTNAIIARHFDMQPQAIVYHTNRLLDAGLIGVEKGFTTKGKEDNRRKIIKIKREGRFVLRWV